MTPALDRSIPVRTLVTLVVGALVGAAVLAIALRSGAATADEEAAASSYQPITPCRVADTRPSPDRVGSNATFAVEDTKVFDLGADGDSGECDPIAADVTAVALNITALNATEQSFLTVWPSGDLPLAASLNPAPGQPPVPNAVTTQVTESSFSIYNDKGTVDVVIDLVGVYTAVAAPSDFVVVADDRDLTLNAGDTGGLSAFCPDGLLAVSGGASVGNLGPGAVISLRSSVPRSDLTGWTGGAIAVTNGATGTITVYAVCAKNVTLAPTS